VEWCMRARAAGYSIGFAPRAVVGHPARRHWSEMEIRGKRLNSEAYQLMRLRPGGRARWLVKSLLMPASAVAHSFKVLASSRLKRPGDRFKAIAVLYRVRWLRMVDGLRLLTAGSSSSAKRGYRIHTSSGLLNYWTFLSVIVFIALLPLRPMARALFTPIESERRFWFFDLPPFLAANQLKDYP
jgi:hypothetical protein